MIERLIEDIGVDNLEHTNNNKNPISLKIQRL